MQIMIRLAKDDGFGRQITEAKAKDLAEEIQQVVKNNWEHMAKEYGLSRGQIENMRPAFIN